MRGRTVSATVALSLALSACVGGGAVPERPSYERAPTMARPLSGAVRQPVRATPMEPAVAVAMPGATTAVATGLMNGPPVASLPITQNSATRALAAFRTSCPTLVRRADLSGLTKAPDWQPACSAASAVSSGGERAFFQRWFETVQVGDGRAFATGYYIPEIAGSRERRAGYAPIYARPSDLVEVDLGAFSTELQGKKIRGRIEGGKLVPYFDRAAIDAGAIDGRTRILGWAQDPVELFFLQIQGSGLVRMPDGGVLRIGYDTQNGREYTGIGALMKARGLIAPGQASMQGLVAWLHANPERGVAIMHENKSYVFFRELNGPPLGALGLPVADGATVAADPKFIPLGAPVFLSMDRTDATGLWVAQDTGGAIRGANRFDTFWGAGDDARAIAGGMSTRGTAFLLLPVGTVARTGNGTSRP